MSRSLLSRLLVVILPLVPVVPTLLPLSLSDQTADNFLTALLRLFFLCTDANSQLGPSRGSLSHICSKNDSLGFSGNSSTGITGADVRLFAGEGVGRIGVECGESWLY